MAVQRLGYAGVSSTDLESWEEFFRLADTRVKHLEDGSLAVRVDAWTQRFLVLEGDSEDLAFVGWEIGSQGEFERQVEALSHFDPKELTAPELELRGIEAGVWLNDPSGIRVELFHGPKLLGEVTMPERTNFVTGDLGLGHAVLAVDDVSAAVEFYRDHLGFQLSDSCYLDDGEIEVTFLRCNPRHHSLALANTPGEKRLEHLMLETADLDAVGRAFDRFSAAGRIKTNLGRHSNDHMLSFYAQTPSGPTFEYGWGGDLVESAGHVPSVFDRESAWGHANVAPAPVGS